MRVAVIGAKRRRHGIGEFVARWFHDLGEEVVAVVGSTPETAREAAGNLAENYGIAAAPFDDVERCLAEAAPDAVAICSPHERHREHLGIAGRAGVHALCEKPMWWSDGAAPRARGVREETERLVTPFTEHGRHLALVTQWPMALAGYRRLYPESESEPLERFEMHLCPPAPGADMIPDAMPHPLSMVTALVGPGRVHAPRGGFRTAARDDLEIAFDWAHEGGSTEVACRFTVKESPPRPATFALNGRPASREIRLPEYTMLLVAGNREEPIEDPLRAHLRRFVERIEAGATPDTAALVAGMAALADLHRAVAEWEER